MMLLMIFLYFETPCRWRTPLVGLSLGTSITFDTMLRNCCKFTDLLAISYR